MSEDDEQGTGPPAGSTAPRTLADPYRAYVERSPHALFVVDEQGRYRDANPAACRLSDFTREELLERTIADLSVGEPPMAAFATLKDEGRVSVEQLMRRKDGAELLIVLDAVALAPGRFMAFATDVTERRAKESALERERDRAQQVLDTVEALIVSLDREGRITLINRKGCDILGYAEHELLGRSWFDTCIPETHRPELLRFFRHAMAGAPAPSVAHYSNPVVTADGSIREIAWHNRMLRDDAGRLSGTLSAGQDVTEQKKLEARLLQTQKLEALGTLAGGVAHDMNNVLASVVALTSVVIERQIPPVHPARANLESVMTAANRGKSLVANLLDFARKGRFERRAVDLNAVVERLHATFAPLVPEEIELQAELAAELEPAFIDEDQISQVLVNLCINAADAMDGRGTITIETSAERVDTAQIPELPAGPYVRVDVTDTGEGMSEEVGAKAFEPFFTTKAVGRGTGLGLSMAYGVLHRHHGTIRLESRPGEGTRVSLWMPVVEEAERRTAAAPADRRTASARPSGEEERPTLLLVEDDELLRAAMSQLLEHFGYQMHATARAEDAIEIYRTRGSEIDLVLLDMSMPGMDGLQCLVELQKLDPQVRVIICTGHGKEWATDEAVRRGCLSVVGKPIDPHRLDHIVRRALS